MNDRTGYTVGHLEILQTGLKATGRSRHDGYAGGNEQQSRGRMVVGGSALGIPGAYPLCGVLTICIKKNSGRDSHMFLI